MYKDSDSDTIKAMRPEMEKLFNELADEVEAHVPQSGRFQPLLAFYSDKTASMDIVNWAMKVRNLIYDGCEKELWHKRYLELVGYVGGGYCGTLVVGSGSVEECAALLRSPDFVWKVMREMADMLDWTDG